MPIGAFKVGDRVRLMDEPGEGSIASISGGLYYVTIDGLDLPYEAHQMVKVEHDELIKRKIQATPLSDKDKQRRSAGKQQLSKLAQAEHAVYELDLHIHELLDRFENMSNGEILHYQMSRCRAFLKEAFDKRYPKVILIRGVGEGVLRTEIHQLLDSLDHVEYHDAPYRSYGYGATEVIFHR
ncbi:MAG: Smr/MutS family protein [Salibacteraceae bacterium]